MLDNVVSVLILDEGFRVVMQLVQYRSRLLRSAVLKDALDDAASVRVRRERQDLLTSSRNKNFNHPFVAVFDISISIFYFFLLLKHLVKKGISV